LRNLEKIKEAPTIAEAKAYLRRIERQARDLEKTLSWMDNWLRGPLSAVLDPAKPWDKDPLFLSADGGDLLPALSFDSKGCNGWQKRLDALSRWAGKAAENMEDASRGGPLNMASLSIGNPKEQFVLHCEKILIEFHKHHGLSRILQLDGLNRGCTVWIA